MKVLVGCEFSGAVRDAFIRAGHEAISCDLMPTETPGPHYQGDIRDMLSEAFDLAIFFPPCTHLAVSGAAWFAQKRADGRQQEGIDFFMLLANANYERLAIENPVGIMSTQWKKPSQIIQPYEFGHPESKKTCLWLKGLPNLTPTNRVEQGERVTYASGRSMPKWYADAWGLPAADRAKLRSKTFPGVAEAMATQWGNCETETNLFTGVLP